MATALGWGDRIRQRVRELGLTDSAVARALDIPQRRFANYTGGLREPDFAMLLRVCRVLRTTPDEVLGAAVMPSPSEDDAFRARLEAAVLGMSEADRRRALAVVEALAALPPIEGERAPAAKAIKNKRSPIQSKPSHRSAKS